MRVALLMLICCAADCAAATASGRNWRISIDELRCEAAAITLGAKIRYLGPKGPVEAPVIRLVDGKGTRHAPKSLIWKRGSKPHAEWLSGGGLSNLQAAEVGDFQLRFEVGGASGDLQLEFGDIHAFALTRGGKGGCGGLLKPGQIQATSAPRAANTKPAVRIYRGRYPCAPAKEALRTVEADHPPYLPRQLLLFGRGYLPAARDIELPMGRAPAQPYAYAGADELAAVEAAARRAIARDFPEYGARHFAFNWGVQKDPGGNELYSIGLYEVRACPK